MFAHDQSATIATMEYIENRTYDEIAVGDHAELIRTLCVEENT